MEESAAVEPMISILKKPGAMADYFNPQQSKSKITDDVEVIDGDQLPREIMIC
jgi:hypothetical protein